jgi:hypothetical protein
MRSAVLTGFSQGEDESKGEESAEDDASSNESKKPKRSSSQKKKDTSRSPGKQKGAKGVGRTQRLSIDHVVYRPP